MNLEPEFTAKPQEGEGGLFSLAILSHLAGAVAGLIGGIFRLSLDQADRFRDALIAWAHGEKLAGFLLVAATCTAAARGRQMLHEISGDGTVFGVRRLMGERMRSIVAWSRLFVDQEVLVAFSTDPEQPITAYSTIEPRFRAPGHLLKLIFWHTAGRRVAATARVGGRAPGPAACGSADRPARWVRDVSSGFRPG